MVASDNKTLTGKRVLISGAGRGIGRATAVLLASRGADIVAVSRTASDLEDLKTEIAGTSEQHSFYSLDLSSIDDIGDLDEKLRRDGMPDVIVANLNARKPYRRMDESEFSLSDDDLTGSLRYLFTILPSFIRHQKSMGFGRWIGISSIVAKTSGPGQAIYAAEKNMLMSLMRSIALEYGRFGITANTVSPGFIRTEGTLTHMHPGQFRRLSKMNALGREGRAEEVAHAVAFLADPAASYITGIDIPVTGGFELGWMFSPGVKINRANEEENV